MSQQAIDLRTSMRIVRRHRRLFGAIVALGFLIGAGYTVLKPPMLTGTALVVLPQAPAQSGTGTSSGTTGGTDTASDLSTQAVIASSNPVLLGALPHISPPMSLQALQNAINVKSLTGSILSISGSGKTPAQAEATANAVANSYISYVGAANSPVGHVPAKLLESATNATGTKLPERIAVDGILGALAGALVGFIVSLAIGRNDRRLTERDSIANSVGIPVLASFPVEHPSDAIGWAKLLGNYEPSAVYAWRLRSVLLQLGIGEPASASATTVARSVTILSFATDPRALAIGPQLASFAASIGIPTTLVIGPQQDLNAAATLRTAAATGPQASERMRYLQVVASEVGDIRMPRDTALVVVVAVLDARAPQMPDTFRTARSVLGVSAGTATSEQLARAAAAAAAADREIFGILVADPEPGDQTTGRIPRLDPPVRRQLPTRVTDVPTEISR